jgi:hypothetical protein
VDVAERGTFLVLADNLVASGILNQNDFMSIGKTNSFVCSYQQKATWSGSCLLRSQPCDHRGITRLCGVMVVKAHSWSAVHVTAFSSFETRRYLRNVLEPLLCVANFVCRGS